MTDWKKNRAAWVAALREEDRKQTTRALKDSNGQCCLGVLCEVAGIPSVLDGSGYHYNHHDAFAPPEATEFVGLKDPEGRYNREQSLTSHNDDGYCFSYIADIIESEPDGLFRE